MVYDGGAPGTGCPADGDPGFQGAKGVEAIAQQVISQFIMSAIASHQEQLRSAGSEALQPAGGVAYAVRDSEDGLILLCEDLQGF